MKKRFITKKKKRRFSIFIVLFIIILSFAICLSYFSSLFSNEKFINFLLHFNTGDTIIEQDTNILDFLLDYTIGSLPLEDEVYIGTEHTQEYTEDMSPEENKENPIIYIYNTHQGEEYIGDSLSEHDIIPTVMLASYRLREQLNKKGINTIVETNPISEVLRTNNWNYASSYKASKLLMEDAKNKNNTLAYFFDVHRDAVSYENSITEYNNKTYAKVLFVIGVDHDNYENNLNLANKMNDLLLQKVPNISRGILKKGGKGVNGIYNQDFSSNTLLFELGGQYNKVNEINNTISILAEVIYETIR